MNPAPQPSVAPTRIFQLLNAFQQSAALKAAIELKLFTAIAEGATSVPALAKKIAASERGTRILADYLSIMGLLTKSASGAYGLTPESATFLDERSPAYVGVATRFLASPDQMQRYSELTEVVRKGGTVAETTMSPEHPVWIDFARGMMPLRMPSAQVTAQLAGSGPMKVLDVAAGHGLFGIMVAKHNPQAQIVAVDWKPVLTVARENAEKFGVADRYTTIAGSVFDVELGKDFDLVLLPGFMHHFDQATNEKLLRKMHAALKPNGRVITLEFVPNPDRVTPPETAGFSLVMLVNTEAGDAYTFAEFDRMFRNAGFARSEVHEIANFPERAIVSYKT